MTELHRLSATEAVALLERREISAEALVRACLARIAEREPEVRAWECVDERGALREARRIDAMASRPLLLGLPVGVKDIIDTTDLPTGYGSPLYRGHRPVADAACVAALRAAGAVVLGKTVTTEFAFYSPGKTRNPHDLARTPGGSSSGSAAAVADFMVPAALGTQTAGSVIRPASFCGVIGFKPTFGWCSLQGVRPIARSLDTLGLFARRLADLPLLGSAIAGAKWEVDELARAPRIGACRTEQWPKATPEAQHAVEAAASELSRSGVRVRELELGAPFAGLADAQAAIMAVEALDSFRVERAEHEAQLSPSLRELLASGERCSADRYQAALRQAEECRRLIATVFAEHDALLTPSATGEAPVGLESTGDPAFSRIWTLLGVPCLSLPGFVGPGGLPIGIQLAGGRGEERRLLATARWIRHALPALSSQTRS